MGKTSFVKTLKGKLWYGIGAIGLDLSYGMFYSFYAKFMTDILHLNKKFLLLLTPLARIWDGINDPMMGSLVDSTRTKMGKYRPWIIAGSCCNAVVLALMFINPGFSPVPLHIFAALMYVLWGMTNTMADIPYWSMVPSFTNDPGERSIIATIARTFSGLGQGIVSIGAPIILSALSTVTDPITGDKVWDARGFMFVAIGCAVCLVMFSGISVSRVRERQVVQSKEKFSFSKIIRVIRGNDQLRIFMIFAMLSNAGFYMFSGVAAYFFDVVAGNADGQGTFNTFGAIGSIVGLAVIPIMMKFTTRRRTYQFSLALAMVSYVGMFIAGFVCGNYKVMSFLFLFGSIGTASMFVSQTVFLSDIVDYGEVKLGYRSESVTFSMKGFLQKMAYTIQTIILFAGLEFSGYNETLHSANSEGVKTSIGLMMLAVPIVFMLLSLIVFSVKFKLHGPLMEEITQKVDELKTQRLASENKQAD